MTTKNQFQLFKSLRFAPFFWTQFLGAFNDNCFKTALLAIITYQGLSLGGLNSTTLVNVCAGLFILPFFLFSATAGQLADKYEKAFLIRKIKILEIIIMIIAAAGFYFNNLVLLLSVLFLLGAQSSLFGPVKYSILPQMLKESELVGGNGLVEMGTFVAILLGTLFSGVIVQIKIPHQYLVSGSCFAIAVIGYLASRWVPKIKSHNPELKISFNIFKQTHEIIKFSLEKRSIFLSILGISWFWFFGSIVITQIFNYVKEVLVAQESVVTLVLTCFSLGVGLGSMSCEKLSGHRVEIGLVPFGAFGLTFFSILLYFLQPHAEVHAMIGLGEFLSTFHNWLLVCDLTLIGVFGGFFIVPLYTLIQTRSAPEKRSRIIAANNIINALFMVFASIFAIVSFSLGSTIPQLFLLVGILNLLVALYIFTLVPEFMMRFLVWIIVSLLYRVRKQAIEECIPETGPAVIICNHISFVDALVIAACVPRPIRFVMDHQIFKTPVLSFIFRTAKAIPIATEKENPEIKQRAFDSVAEALEKGELVGIFPEGGITRDGELHAFKPGIEKIIKRTPVPVIPLALSGLWGSFFSRKYGKAMSQFPKRFRYPIRLSAGEAVAPEDATMQVLYDKVLVLRGDDR